MACVLTELIAANIACISDPLFSRGCQGREIKGTRTIRVLQYFTLPHSTVIEHFSFINFDLAVVYVPTQDRPRSVSVGAAGSSEVAVVSVGW